MSRLLVGGLLAALVMAIGGGPFLTLALFLGIPRPERDSSRRPAFSQAQLSAEQHQRHIGFATPGMRPSATAVSGESLPSVSPT
jgi:hypothetical protein